MYKAIYSAMADETSDAIRENEKQAFERSLTLLRAAQEKGRGSRESVEALLFVNRLWTILMEDLALDDNRLPQELRASLISIGIWVLRRAEDIRQGRVADFSALIEVSESIKNGLRVN